MTDLKAIDQGGTQPSGEQNNHNYRNEEPDHPPNPSQLESGQVSTTPQPRSQNYLSNKSIPFQILFITITCATQLIAQGQFGMLIIPLNDLGPWLGTDDAGQMSWMAASYGLTLGIMVVLSGRLGDLFGPKLIWSIGCIFGIASNIGSGFCKTPVPFDICRAISGMGAALSLPNALAILGRTYPPGKMRNLVFAILGALAPSGFLIGGAVAAIFTVLADVRWIWWFTAIFIFVFLISGLLVLPSDYHPSSTSASAKVKLSDKIRSFDYIGTALLILSMGLFNFVWNQSALVGWEEPYIYVLLIISVLGFGLFYFYEKRVGSRALIPMEVLGRQSLLVYLTLWLGWMSFGTYLLYTKLFITNIRGHHNALVITAQMAPLMPGGIAAALLVPMLIHRFAGHKIFLIAMIAFFIGDLFAALTPVTQTYWGLTFWSLLIVVFGPDLSFSTGQLIVSNSVDHEFQGIAAGIVSMITNYSLSIGLGLAGTIERYVKGPENESPEDLLGGYRAAFWLATGLAGLAVIVVALFVRMPKQSHGHEKEGEA
ncbi:hypothetical protein I302_100546 [Kwoniella bestiolae CBS 10118]|uniref:Major facilitator superfamily (MFS) profile domain-containing protein n=1 Tax=Kwoniella bestiolae CBS 10118 TaxID=1296100 RepID=A0A1B9G5G5_9TREE|nr:hypothetical protein I302_03921 [Kwoniella bestiolae CBS 10118]OCF26242.1 hypothetical protein I302_03921 [Kwoniella bestiolae CBS 10118]